MKYKTHAKGTKKNLKKLDEMTNYRLVHQSVTQRLISIFLLSLLLILAASENNNNNNNNNAVETVGRPLTISQACAPKSRSRHTVDIDSITLSCYDENGNMADNVDFYSDSSTSSSAICSIGGTGRLVVDCKYSLLANE